MPICDESHPRRPRAVGRTRPFSVAVDADVLADLMSRLRRSRFVGPTDSLRWAAGADPDYLRELTTYWTHEFDWRTVERRLNTFPHHLVEIGGSDLHFVHVRAASGSVGAQPALPILLAHGWPSTFVELLDVVGPLTDPQAHGLEGPGFDVVVPSLPGFVFSEPMRGHFTREALGDIWHRLMTDVLRYPRYGLFGGDIGGGGCCWAAAKYPQSVAGLQVIHPPPPADYDPPANAAEQRYLDALDVYDETTGAYSPIMETRPDTLAAALIDSPVGLAAWIVDKFHDWSDHDGELSSIWSHADVLTVATLYWVTSSIGTSMRQYYDYHHNRPRPRIDVPSAVLLSREPSRDDYPRSIAERALSDIRRWTVPERGGHFLAFEQPDTTAREIRAFFSELAGA